MDASPLIIGCFQGFSADLSPMMLFSASIAVAFLIMLALMRLKVSNRTKLVLIYAHLTAVLFPFVTLATDFGCGTMCMSCHGDVAKIISIGLPSTLVASGILGFVAIPGLFLLLSRGRTIKDGGMLRFISKYSRAMGIKTPSVYAIDSAKPKAFSFKTFRSAIFLSAGLADILSKRELEAVLLHELAHVRSKASIFRISSLLLRISPMSYMKSFDAELDDEERSADDFVASVQRTRRYLKSARAKLVKFD
jgi:Zn-dependent protease with chaperone function